MKNVAWKLAPAPSVIIKNQAQPLLENKLFETSWLYWICSSKTFDMSKSACIPPQFSFYRGIFEYKKDLKPVSRLRFFVNFFGKNFDFVKLHQLAKFNYQTVFTSQIIH